jgi:hypothetical protein
MPGTDMNTKEQRLFKRTEMHAKKGCKEERREKLGSGEGKWSTWGFIKGWRGKITLDPW